MMSDFTQGAPLLNCFSQAHLLHLTTSKAEHILITTLTALVGSGEPFELFILPQVSSGQNLFELLFKRENMFCGCITVIFVLQEHTGTFSSAVSLSAEL